MDLALPLDYQNIDLRSAQVDPGAHQSSLLDAPMSAGFEEGKHGEYSSMGVGSSGDPKLAEDVLDVLLDGAFGYPERLCDCGVGASLRHAFHDSPLPRPHPPKPFHPPS